MHCQSHSETERERETEVRSDAKRWYGTHLLGIFDLPALGCKRWENASDIQVADLTKQRIVRIQDALLLAVITHDRRIQFNKCYRPARYQTRTRTRTR
jgi:hypothetical protein